MIKFNQNLWLKSYIDINTKLRQKAELNFEKDLSKLMDNAIFRKTKGSVIKLVSRERRRNYLYHNQIIMLQNVSQKIY